MALDGEEAVSSLFRFQVDLLVANSRVVPIDVLLQYSNSFTCIPLGLPFRPTRSTPRPIMHGPQTAFVEVIVHFLEGDPDRPIIVGSVFNALRLPPEPDLAPMVP